MTEIGRLQFLVWAQEEYIEFLGEGCMKAEAFCAIHGVKVSEEDVVKGERLRAAIARANNKSL